MITKLPKSRTGNHHMTRRFYYVSGYMVTVIRADASPDSFHIKDEINEEWARTRLAYETFANSCEDDGVETKEARVLRLERIEKVAAHVEEIAERRKRLTEEAKASLTDPDCQFMLIKRVPNLITMLKE